MISKKDNDILSHLRTNSRASLTEISKETNIPISTVFDKIKNLEKKIIHKHTSIIDFSKMGYNLRIRIMLQTKKPKELISYLNKHSQVNNIYKISEKYDYLIECYFKNMLELNQFSEKIEEFEVLRKEEYHIISAIKEESFLTKAL